MKQEIVEKLIDEYSELFELLPVQQMTSWTLFAKMNEIASRYENVDCLMHVNFANGAVTQGMCVFTDWKPGALALQSDDGKLPKLRIIAPDVYASFMGKMEHILEAQYPEFPKEQG